MKWNWCFNDNQDPMPLIKFVSREADTVISVSSFCIFITSHVLLSNYTATSPSLIMTWYSQFNHFRSCTTLCHSPVYLLWVVGSVVSSSSFFFWQPWSTCDMKIQARTKRSKISEYYRLEVYDTSCAIPASHDNVRTVLHTYVLIHFET